MSVMPSCDGIIPMFSFHIYLSVVMKMKRINPQRRSSLVLRMLRLLRMNRGFENPLGNQEEIVQVGIPASKIDQDIKQPKTYNVQAYILGNHRMHEIERQKAMAISISRHTSWKAGGPQ